MEYVLQHLGPSAEPLTSFLYQNEAANLLFTSKFIGELVSTHQKRWGFKRQIFMKDRYGYLRINNKVGYTLLPSLESGEYFFIEIYHNLSSRLWRYKDNGPRFYSAHFFDADETVQIASEMKALGYRVETSH